MRGESGPVAVKSNVGYTLSGSFCNSAIANSTVFVCHFLKYSFKIVTDTLDETVESFLGIAKTWN